MHHATRFMGAALFAATSLGAGCLGVSEREPGDYGPWMGGAPIVGDLDGDGVEELVATFADGGIMALRGTDYSQSWHRLDRRIAVRDARRMAVVTGGAVVLALPRAIEVLGGEDGATRTKIDLSDEVSRLCAEGGKVGVFQIDKVSWTLDVATGKRDDTAAPVKCRDMETRPILCDSAVHARCEGDFAVKKAKFTDPVTGDVVGVELKDPGTPEVTIVGYDGAGKSTWRLPFDPTGGRITALDLVGGTLLIRQSLVSAIDARSGTVLWTSTCGHGSNEAMVGTATRVYFVCTGPRSAEALRIVDRATGAVIKDIGKPR